MPKTKKQAAPAKETATKNRTTKAKAVEPAPAATKAKKSGKAAKSTANENVVTKAAVAAGVIPPATEQEHVIPCGEPECPECNAAVGNCDPVLPEAPTAVETTNHLEIAKKHPKPAKEPKAPKPKPEPQVNRYSIEIPDAQREAFAKLTPSARKVAETLMSAGKPLTLAEWAEAVKPITTSKRRDRWVAWHCTKIFRPMGILSQAKG